MIFALEGNFAYSFMLGVLAAVNPCGFVLLPAYLLYFLGIDSDNKQAPVKRALVVSAAVSSGFLLVFVIIGTISRLFTQWIELNAKYAGLLIGLALVVMGIAMLAGWKPSFITPTIAGQRDRSLRAMFVFGIAYAVASIGCTIGFLTTAIFGSIGVHGFASGVISIVLYGSLYIPPGFETKKKTPNWGHACISENALFITLFPEVKPTKGEGSLFSP